MDKKLRETLEQLRLHTAALNNEVERLSHNSQFVPHHRYSLILQDVCGSCLINLHRLRLIEEAYIHKS